MRAVHSGSQWSTPDVLVHCRAVLAAAALPCPPAGRRKAPVSPLIRSADAAVNGPAIPPPQVPRVLCHEPQPRARSFAVRETFWAS